MNSPEYSRSQSPKGDDPGVRIIDPENGFRRIFHSVRKSFDYSLVVVPPRAYFRMDYMKPSADIKLDLELVNGNTDNLTWFLIGQIDSDTYANLGLNITALRRGPNPPVVSPENLEQARTLGLLTEIGTSQTGLPLYKVELEIPPQKVTRFFYQVWRPQLNPAYRDTSISRIRVGYLPEETRVLPQKTPLLGDNKQAILRVYSH